MSAPDLCPALLHDRPEERVVCIWEPGIKGAWGFICNSCLKDMLDRLEDRKAIAEEWEL